MAETERRYRAKAKNLSISPYKVRPVADIVRMKTVSAALSFLRNHSNKGARFLCKVVASAAANAQAMNDILDEDQLYIRELLVDEGPSRKKVWPRGRGRADKLTKRTAHITVVLDEMKRGKA